MATSFKTFAFKTVVVGMTALVIGFVLITYFKFNLLEFYAAVNGPPASEVVRKQIQSESRLVTDSYGNSGSGCEPVPNFVFSARHVVGDAILDKTLGIEVDVFVSGNKARIYSYSGTHKDYVILTSSPQGTKFPKEAIRFSKQKMKIGQTLYTFSHPGDFPQLHQKLEVMKIDTDSKGKIVQLTVKGDYVEVGISGGCVNDDEGGFVGIIKQKRQPNDPRTKDFGIVTVIDSVD